MARHSASFDLACLASGATLLAASASAQPTFTDPELVAEEIVTGLDRPTTMAFLGRDDFLILEQRLGQVLRVKDGVLHASPVLDVAVNSSSGRGLLGIDIDEQDPPNVFLYYTEVPDPDGDGSPDSGEPLGNRLYRYVWNETEGILENPVLLFDLPATPAERHNGGVVVLAPPAPVAGVEEPVQAVHTVIGDLDRDGELQNFPGSGPPDDTSTIFRILPDGSPHPENPFFPYCSVTIGQTCASDAECPGGETCLTQVAQYFGYGVRNCFGLALDPRTGNLWDTENGPANYDEVNLVAPGFNSGWEKIMGPDARDPQATGDLFDMPGAGSTYSDPEFSWLEPVAPTGIVFPVGSALGARYDGSALVGDSNNGDLHRFLLNAARDGFDFSATPALQDLVADDVDEAAEAVLGSGLGRIVDLKIGPDRALYAVSIFPGTVFRVVSKARRPRIDLDGDGRSDLGIFRAGRWFFDTDRDGATDLTVKFGNGDDIPVPGDYDGDAVIDLAVFRPSMGRWLADTDRDGSTDLNLRFGVARDVPVPADYDGDGTIDIAVFRPANGYWFIDTNRNGITDLRVKYGTTGDIPIPTDLDGDRRADLVIYRPSAGRWLADTDRNGTTDRNVGFGGANDQPLPMDFDGDGAVDFVLWRPSTGEWYVDTNLDGLADHVVKYGIDGDVAVPGSHDGTAAWDLAVFRPSMGRWLVDANGDGSTDESVTYGLSTDRPLREHGWIFEAMGGP